MSSPTRLGVITALVAVSTLAVLPAQGLPMDRDARGRCSDGARWELSLDRELTRIEVDFEIDGPRRSNWTATISHNGDRVLRQTRQANLRGEVEFTTSVRAPRGTEHVFAVSARNGSGQTCRTTLAL